VECIIAPYVGAGTTTKASATATMATTLQASQVCSLSSTEQAHYLPSHGNGRGVTEAAYDAAGATVVLPFYAGYAYGRYVLGSAEMTGSIIKTAVADLNSQTDQWEVDVTMTASGSALFNKYAARHYACYVQNESNPPYCALEAIELDGTVESAPAIEAASFMGAATINGSASHPFTAQQASDMAVVLNSGPLPVGFVAVSISTVSPL
jgi:preprotein translocase subunit SecD